MKFNIKNLDVNLKKSKKKIRFCKNCVVSNLRPRISFNEDGICSACEWSYEKHNIIDWKEREKELIDLLNRHRSKDGSHDVIVPGSGGKDSFYVAHELKHTYNMNPITITFAPFEWTEVGKRNFVKFSNMGIPNLLITPNQTLHRSLATVGLNFLGDPWQPFEFGQTNLPFRVSDLLKIKLCFFGENGELEYGGSKKYKFKSKKDPEDFVEHYQKGVKIEKLVELALENKIINKNQFSKGDMSLYQLPDLEKIKDNKTERHWFSYFKKWIPQENFYHAKKYYDFEINDMGRSEQTYTKYASLDDKLDGFHFYFGYLKFGLGRASRDAMQDIRNLHLTRKEAIRLVERFDSEFPIKHFNWMLDYLNINEKDFREISDFYRSESPAWYKDKDKWLLRHKVY